MSLPPERSPGSTTDVSLLGAAPTVRTPAASDCTAGATTVLSSPAPVAAAEAPLEESGFGARYAAGAVLGRGGMGEVRLYRDARIGREVAMKVVSPEADASGDTRARFLREARLQGQLEHPSVVPVYDLGVDPSGAPYFTMKRVRGLTLEAILAGLRRGDEKLAARYTTRRLLAAFTSVCLGVDFAHARGVLHRDLKPGNVMLGDFGEVYVLDWGLAKLVGEADAEAAVGARASGARAGEDAGEARTVDGAILGTPGYMAPEQATGAPVDRRADVYALGAILFELLTLRPLHEGAGEALLYSTLRGAEARPSLRVPEREVAPELEAICVRATARDPAARHASARELLDEIERYLEGDRDLELRRALAARHAAEAESLADRALDGGDEPARARALAEAGRALGLEPSNAAAIRTLVRLLVTPPERLPAEAEAELVRAEDVQARTAGRLGAIAYLSWLLFTPFFLALGMRSWAPALLALGCALAASAQCLLLARTPRLWRTSLPTGIAVAATLAIGFMSRAFGPLLLVPSVAATNTIGFMVSPRHAQRLLHMMIGGLAVAVPLGLELLGVLDRSYRFDGGVLSLVPHMTGMPERATLVVLGLSTLGCIVLPAAFVGRMRSALADAERRLHVQAWHLARLVPREALGATPIVERS